MANEKMESLVMSEDFTYTFQFMEDYINYK